MQSLYPEIEPYRTDALVRGVHTVHYEVSGNPNGIPVVFLHGGPGSGCKTYHRSFFDPNRYCIILMDQRGSGCSSPGGCIENNTTQDLLEDLESIRTHLGIDAWVLFGGSWGATLALLYAEQYPENVTGLILRGAFLARKSDLDWFAGPEGVRKIYPDDWDHLLSQLLPEDRYTPVESLFRMLTGSDELSQRRAARAWEQWGGRIVLGDAFDPSRLEAHVLIEAVHQAKIELHYALSRYFIEENEILLNIDRIQNIPTWIIHGRKDMVCPLDSAWSLHRALPESSLEILPQGGHIASTEDMIDALVRATDSMADHLERI